MTLKEARTKLIELRLIYHNDKYYDAILDEAISVAFRGLETLEKMSEQVTTLIDTQIKGVENK